MRFRQALVEYSLKHGVTKASIRYKTNRQYVYRWRKRYDGTIHSLADKSHRPHSHPNQHTPDELKLISDMRRRNPHAGLVVFWVKLCQRGYSRSITGLYRILRKQGQMAVKPKNPKYIPKPYEQMLFPGQRVQIDVKFVPKECKADTLPFDKKYYQYTCIDEASRERFIYHYEEHTPANTVDFAYRCFLFYGYKPEEIQTDNGTEFTWNQDKMKTIHPLQQLCINENIYHHKIRPRTPRHNGKVERSHRNDNERFYNYLKFYSLEDLRYQAKLYLKRSNNIPMATLGYKTPNEYRKILEENKKINSIILN